MGGVIPWCTAPPGKTSHFRIGTASETRKNESNYRTIGPLAGGGEMHDDQIAKPYITSTCMRALRTCSCKQTRADTQHVGVEIGAVCKPLRATLVNTALPM